MEKDRERDRQVETERTRQTDRWRQREDKTDRQMKTERELGIQTGGDIEKTIIQTCIIICMETERELDRLREIRRQTENLTDRHMETKRELEITDR